MHLLVRILTWAFTPNWVRLFAATKIRLERAFFPQFVRGMLVLRQKANKMRDIWAGAKLGWKGHLTLCCISLSVRVLFHLEWSWTVCRHLFSLDVKCGCLNMFVQDTDMQFLCRTLMHWCKITCFWGVRSWVFHICHGPSETRWMCRCECGLWEWVQVGQRSHPLSSCFESQPPV